MTTSPSRRRFLADVTAAVAIAVAQPDAQTAGSAGTEARLSWREGWRASGGRGDQALLVSARPLRDGEPGGERGRRADEAQVEVTLSRGFWTATWEVTQGQWKQLMGKFPDKLPSPEFGEGDNFPVYWINFTEAEGYCAELSRRGHHSGVLPEAWEFRLPTEAQWESACRAGTSSATVFGDSLARHQANFAGEARIATFEQSAAHGTPAAIRPIPGASMTCTGTSGNGAATTTTRNSRAGRIPICMS